MNGKTQVLVGSDGELYCERKALPDGVEFIAGFDLRGFRWRPYTPKFEDIFIAANHLRVEATTLRTTDASEAILGPLEEYLKSEAIPHQINRNVQNYDQFRETTLWTLMEKTIQ